MRNLVLGLAAVLWAQTSTAWKWYGYTQENSPDSRIYPVSNLSSSQKGVVRYQSDTVYVMGTYVGSDNTNMELPDTVGSSIDPTISGADDYERTYLAAYDRHTGAILWWMYFYHRSGGTSGQDMAVASDGTVYLLLIGRPGGLDYTFQARGGRMVSGGWNDNLSGDRASYLLKIQPYEFFPLVAQSSIGLGGLGRGSRACDLKHLLLVGDTLLFASGEFYTSIASNLNAVSSTSSTLFRITSPVSNTQNRGLLVRWNLAAYPNLTSPTAAQLRYEGPPNADVTGHRLAYDPVSKRIRWLVEMGDLAQRSLIYDLSTTRADDYQIIINGPSQRVVYTLRVFSIKMDLSLPSDPNYHNLSRTADLPVRESPYLFSYNDTLVWSRSMWYTSALIDGGSFTTIDGTFGYDHALLVEQILSGGGNDAQLSRHVQIPQARRLHLSGMAVEREGELVYLSGAANGQSWGPGNALPLGLKPNSRSGFLMGLRRTPSSYRIVGYRRFFSVSVDFFQNKVEAIGMAYNPAQAQFYLLGTAQDSLLMRPVWPLGRADTIRPSSIIPERLWVGRLDWYRISASGSYTACVPDTITSAPVMIGVSGRNVHTSEVPPGTNPGWLFDWLPLATPWQSTAAPLHIMGPFMGTSEGTYSYGISPLVAQGQFAPGDYCISGTVVPVLAGRRADIIDTLKLTVSGTTVPAMGRATQTALTYLVAPYAGQMGSNIPEISGPYPRYRLENWKFPTGGITNLHYLPYLRGKEALLITKSLIVNAVWSIDLMPGLVDSLPLPPNPNIQGYVPDPVRGTYWTIASRTIPIFITTENLYQAPPPWGTGDSLLIQRPTGRVTVRRDVYPMRYDSIWVKSIARAAILPHGDIIFFGVSYPIPTQLQSDSISLWRVSLEKDTIYRLTEPNPPAGCSQDGMGSGAKVRAPRTEIAVCGDTIYWIEQVPNPCINNNTTYLLRRAYPTSTFPGPLSYQVQTIDTIRLGSGTSLRSYLLYTKLPKPALILGTSNEVVRYQLSTQTRDTLLRCMSRSPLSSLCCRYGLSDWIDGLDDVALLRGGALAVLHSGTVKLAMPIALAGQRDTLLSEGSISSSSIAGGTLVSLGHSQDTLTFDWPDASGPGMDSTYLQVHTTSCTRATKPFFYPFYHLPTFSVNLRGPDTVCVGQVFHTYVQRDTEVVVGTNCRVSLGLFAPATAQQGLVSFLRGENDIVRWQATQLGYDTIRAAIAAPKWSYLVSTSSLAHPIRIRQGHRFRLTTALEGSYNATTFFHRPHPFLTRYNIAAYNQRILGVSSDSLWRLPYVPGDSLMKAWNILLADPLRPCPGAGTWYCDTPWTALARVELRESPSGPVVDSAYALIDTAGRLYFYGAPLSRIGIPIGSADTLHFCHCDPTTPKYITVRFPNHLPLHTPELSLPVRGVGQADSIDLRDPTYLEGIPGEHYTFVPGPGGTLRAAAWAGNCADLHNAFIPGGAHVDAGWINAADYDFVITRNGVTYGGFSIADLNSDGSVDALDAVIVITNQNALRQSSRP
jgi:hypothetical protein